MSLLVENVLLFIECIAAQQFQRIALFCFVSTKKVAPLLTVEVLQHAELAGQILQQQVRL